MAPIVVDHRALPGIVADSEAIYNLPYCCCIGQGAEAASTTLTARSSDQPASASCASACAAGVWTPKYMWREAFSYKQKSYCSLVQLPDLDQLDQLDQAEAGAGAALPCCHHGQHAYGKEA